MAYVVPSDTSRTSMSLGHRSELETLDRLRKELPSDYTIFHGLHWTREQPGDTKVFEVDFVVVNRSGSLVLIEQKSGNLEQTSDGLFKVNERDGYRKNVVDQILRSMNGIRDKLKTRFGARVPVKMDYLIYLPHFELRSVSSPGLDRSRVVDRRGAAELAARIEELLGGAGAGAPDVFKRVDSFLRHTLDIVPSIHAHAEVQGRTFDRLADGLISLIDAIQMSPQRLRIRASAGAGKSLAAAKAFQATIDADKRPLLLCYNRRLADTFMASLPSGGLIQTYNGLCAKFLESQGQVIRYPDASAGDQSAFWRQIEEKTFDATVPDDWRFDRLIVDEGQDFKPEWALVAQRFAKDAADILWFEDLDQNIRGSSEVNLDGFVGINWRRNYRTPYRIANFIRRCLNTDVSFGNPLPGLGVGLHRYDQQEELSARTAEAIAGLRRQGFGNDQIVILSCRSLQNSGLFGLDRIGSVPLKTYKRQYDPSGRQILTSGLVEFDSIGRFKGQEAAAVVLVDVEPEEEDWDRWHRILYTGMTRATIRLELVLRRGNEITDRFEPS